MTLDADGKSAAVGFTVKSGWAAAVLVGGSTKSPRVLDSRRVELSDPAISDARQPYHDGFGTARASGPELSRLLASVKQFGKKSVTTVLKEYRAGGFRLSGTGMVVGSTVDPDTLGSSHVRIHALEGRLFRGVIEDVAVRSGLECSIWRERDLYGFAAGVLKHPESKLRAEIAELGRTTSGPWRAEQKAAALAAWLVLAHRHQE